VLRIVPAVPADEGIPGRHESRFNVLEMNASERLMPLSLARRYAGIESFAPS
jgi:hypothetical protein